jgi:hypothetical protein
MPSLFGSNFAKLGQNWGQGDFLPVLVPLKAWLKSVVTPLGIEPRSTVMVSNGGPTLRIVVTSGWQSLVIADA